MNAEPQLDELSAYLDQELTGTARLELEAHLQSCETCRRRLAALRETVAAVKALPVEAPPRAFTIPPQRRQSSSRAGWAWAGGALAAACLVIVISMGIANLPHGGGAATSFAPASNSRGYSQTAPGFRAVTVTDPQNPSRQLTLSSGQSAFAADQGSTTTSQAAPAVPANGSLQVSLVLQDVPGNAAPTSLSDAGIRLSLSRPGYEVVLTSPETFTATREGGSVRIAATYRLGSIPLPSPAAGDYTLRAAWQGADGSAVALVAQVPITISG